jgi:hypothetical protein
MPYTSGKLVLSTLQGFGNCGNMITCCRALLVDEVLYEPSRLLRKNRKSVLLITGACSTVTEICCGLDRCHAVCSC